MNLTPGLTLTLTRPVTDAMTAQALGSGTLPVLATPAVAALMEEAAWRAIAPLLEPGQTTVGSALDLRHEAPTPVGGTLTVTATLTAVERRKLTFALTAEDDQGPVAHATHERYLVDGARFQEKAELKVERKPSTP